METGYFVTDAPFVNPFQLTPPPNLKLSFAHKTFQEFFAAIHIVMKIQNDKSLQTMLETADYKFLAKNAQVLVFAAGIASVIVGDSNKALELIGKCILPSLRQLSAHYDRKSALAILKFLNLFAHEI